MQPSDRFFYSTEKHGGAGIKYYCGMTIEHSRTTEICQKTCSNFTYTQVSEVQNYFVVGLVPCGLGTSVLNIVSNFVFEKILF